MKCSLTNLIILTAAVLFAMGAALALSFQGIGGWIGAGFIAIGDQAGLIFVSSAFAAYQSCRDQTNGESF